LGWRELSVSIAEQETACESAGIGGKNVDPFVPIEVCRNQPPARFVGDLNRRPKPARAEIE
jgi:hypothetical protein